MLIFSILTTVCGTITLIITAIALASSQLSGPLLLEVLSPFQVQYFGVILAVGAIALCLKFFFSGKTKSVPLMLLSLFCAALLSAQVIPWYVPPILSSKTGNYRVLSANLNTANNNVQAVLAWAKKEQPDLAVFIEVNDQMAEALEVLKATLPYSSNQAYPYQPEAVLYSKYPLTDAEIQKFGTNNAVNITAQTQVGQHSFSIVAIHPLPPLSRDFLESRNTVFNSASEYIASQTKPVILIGDFNVTMWSPHYRNLARQTNLKNTRKGFGPLPTWPVNLSQYLSPKLGFLQPFVQIPIDHCLVSKSLSVAGMHTGDNVGSDHLPIIIDFSIPDISATNASGTNESRS